MTKTTQPDETITLTIEEARKRMGGFGHVAAAMLARHGEYGYTDATTGRKILLRLAR